MNEVQRKVLRAHHGDILKNLVLDTDILGFFLNKEVLTEAMVHSIQAKQTQHEKIIEMMFMLPKRGPRAFPLFLEAVRKHSPYLGDKLEQEYDKELKLSKWADKVSQKTDQKGDPRISAAVTSHEDVKLEDNIPTDPAASTAKAEPETDTPVKPPETSAVATAAANASKPADASKPAEKPVQLSPSASAKPGSGRNRSMSISSTNHVMTSSIMQQNLNNLFTKLKLKLESKNIRESVATTPEPATFKTIDKLLDDLFHTTDEQDTIFSQCHALLGGKDRNYPLVSHIINMQRAKRELEQDLKSKDQQKNKYADHISKLENRVRNQATEISHLNAEVKKLKEELDQLQVVSSEREEKQKIIDELRKMVMEADSSKKGKLRSSYLALHYDGNVTEIKQLRAEIRNLKADNENLKTENLMLKKSDNIKNLHRLREEGIPRHEETGSAVSHSSEDSRDNCRSRTRPVYPVQPAMYPMAAKSMDNDKTTSGGYLSGQKPGRSFLSASVEQLTNLETEETVAAAKLPKTKDKDYIQNLDFKFSNQNGSLGQKRSSSKDRSHKRVTFYGDIDDDGNIGVVRENSITSETLTSELSVTSQKAPSLTNGNSQPSPAKSLPNPKPEKAARGRPPKLKNLKGASKRSASLNSITSNRDIIKMSSHLIQRSRNLRQPIGH